MIVNDFFVVLEKLGINWLVINRDENLDIFYLNVGIIILGVFLFFLIFLIIFGNVLVLIVMFLKKKLCMVFNMFIVFLSFIDFLLGFIVMILVVF